MSAYEIQLYITTTLLLLFTFLCVVGMVRVRLDKSVFGGASVARYAAREFYKGGIVASVICFTLWQLVWWWFL